MESSTTSLNLKSNSHESIYIDKDQDGVSDYQDKESLMIGTKDNVVQPNKKTPKQHKKENKVNTIIKEVRPHGLIAYSVPTQMQVGSEYSVKIRISKQNNRTVLLIGNREIPISDNLDSVKIETITVSPVMSASLLSSKNDFEITSLSTEIQNIDQDGYTEWEWNVIPLKGGENNLKLNVKIRIKEDGNDYYKDITVFQRKIKVKSNLSYSIKDFIFKNWEWFLGVIFIPIFQRFWLFWKKKKEENKKDV